LNQKSQSTEFMQIDEEKEDYLNSEDSNKSPEYRIEFTQSNKIELIPKSLSNQMIQKLTETDTKINKQISQDLEIIEPANEKLFKTNILEREESVQFLAENKINSIEIIEHVLLDKECEIIEFRKEQATKAKILRQESVQFLSQNNKIIYEKRDSKSPEILQVEKEATQDTQESEESESDDDDGS